MPSPDCCDMMKAALAAAAVAAPRPANPRAGVSTPAGLPALAALPTATVALAAAC